MTDLNKHKPEKFTLRMDLKHWYIQLKEQKTHGFTWFDPSKDGDIDEHIAYTKKGLDDGFEFVDEIYK